MLTPAARAAAALLAAALLGTTLATAHAAATMEAEAGFGHAIAEAYHSALGNRLLLAVVSLLLLLLWIFVLRAAPSKQRDASAGSQDTPERLRVFAKWAQQQIQESKGEVHRQMLDDVIFTFATYAQRLQKGSNREVRRAAILRLRVLIELLESPSVNSALRAVNWAWLRDWDRQLLEPREARLRCTAVLPTIVAAAEVQHSEHPANAAPGKLGLAYLASWCTDVLARPDIRAFLTAKSSSATLCTTPGAAGALYSESSEDEVEASPARRRPSKAVDVMSPGFSQAGPETAKGEFCDLARRRFDGQEHCWDIADATEAMVRGESYLDDHIKVPSRSAMLELVHVDLLKVGEEMVHYAQSEKSQIPRLRQDGDDRYFFIINFRLHPIQLAITWAVPKNADWLVKPEGVLFKRFCKMSDRDRNKRVKILPKVTEGPWLVKKSVPDRPGVVGKKLSIEYFSHPDHLEVSINCISSPAGRRIVQVLTGAARHFCMELFVILEGQSQDELPERILGGLSVLHGDLSRIPVR